MNQPEHFIADFLDLVRREAATAATAAVRAELLRLRPADMRGSRLLSLADLAKRYGVGRLEARRLIASGALPSVERRCRGGRIGTFVTIEDAEAVFAGRVVCER